MSRLEEVRAAPEASTTARRDRVVRRIRLLVAFTIAYNLAEAVVALSAGTIAGSAALLGFGLDSVVEVSSAAAVAWQFAGDDHEAREQRALRIVALAFLSLAALVTAESVRALVSGEAPDSSRVGIVLAIVSLVVMPSVSLLQRRAGREAGARAAVADSHQTLLCSYMSGVLLVGLVANAVLGWWWADPLAALAIAGLAVREGLDAWHGKGCCAGSPSLLVPEDGPDHRECTAGCDCC